MKKIVLFSVCLIAGLLLSQFMPEITGESYYGFRFVNGLLLSVALSFIMINVGREFELEKNKNHNIEVIVDRLIIKDDIRSRLYDSIEIASKL